MTTHTSTAGPDLSDPIWTIEHMAAAFHLEVDSARASKTIPPSPPRRHAPRRPGTPPLPDKAAPHP
jgi:hypothetical protein